MKYFSLSSVAVRPEASGVIHARLSKIGYNEHKRAYVEKMLRKIKEKQALMMHNMGRTFAGAHHHLMNIQLLLLPRRLARFQGVAQPHV